MNLADMKKEVMNKISIPQYVYEIIEPNMMDYYSGNYPIDFDNSRYIKCCFHDEDTPSLRWYEETNTFYCFGCGKGGPGERGSVLGMHKEFMKKMNGTMPSDNEAITFLYRYFIEGRTTESVVIANTTTKKLNSESEILALNMYRKEMEKAVLMDKKIELVKKMQFWDKDDEVDMLMSLGEVTCSDCENEIKQAVKEMV